MKRFIVIALLLVLIASCKPTPINSYTANSEGVITHIELSDKGETIIWVSFKGDNLVNDLFEFYGSDTCKVGQKVHLATLK